MDVTRRTMNLTAIVFFIGVCSVFQFSLLIWGVQEIAAWAGGLGLTKYTFLFALMGSLWFFPCGCGVAILVLTVPITFL